MSFTDRDAAAWTLRALIQSGDLLAAMLQTLRLNPTADNAHRACLLLHTMAREGDKLMLDLARGIEP